MKGIHTTGRQLWLSILLMLGTFCVQAEGRFYATIDYTKASVGQTLVVTFVVENVNGGKVSFPAMKDFSIVGGPMTQQSTSIINGAVSRSQSWAYYIQPKHEGACVIEAGRVDVGGSVLNSNAITVQVSAAGKQNGGAASSQGSTASSSGASSDDLFIKVITSKTQAYVGEPIMVTFRVYTSKPVAEVQFPKAASFNGFWKYDIALPQNAPWKPELVNGKRYSYVDFQQCLLFPQKAGNNMITPIEMTATLQEVINRAPRNWAEAMFGGGQEVKNIPMKVQSKATPIKTIDLPAAGKPENFDGLVGSFSIEAEIDKEAVKTDDPVTIKIKINGNGNFEALSNPKPSLPDGMESYDPNIKENFSPNGTTVAGSKTFEYLVIPRMPGDFDIPALELPFFNPATGKYVIATSKAFHIKVSGAPSKQQAPSTPGGVDVKQLKEDIRYIKANPGELRKQKETFFASGTFTTLMSSPLLFMLGLIFLKRKRDASNADVAGTRSRKASKLAIQKLATAQNLMSKGDRRGFYSEANRALYEYLSSKLQVETASMSRALLDEKLSIAGVDDSIKTKLFELIDQFEMALFSPAGESDELKNAYDRAVNMIIEMENRLKK
jgi:BatD DUF11 like domain